MRAIRRLIRHKRTPSGLRKACMEMRKTADDSYKAIMERFQAEADRYEAETRPLVEGAKAKQQSEPKGA